MTFVQIPGKDNLVNLKNDPKLYYIVIGGSLLATIAFALTKNLLTVFTFVLSTMAIFAILNTPPQDIVIKINDSDLNVGNNKVKWVAIDSWVAVTEGNWLEIMIKSTSFTKPYYIFYIPANHPETRNFLTTLTERATYDRTVASQNWLHTWMKRVGLR